MYVCICNGYRDCELRALAQQGVRSAHAAYRSLGAGPRCGRCLSVAQRVIDEHRSDQMNASNGAGSAQLAG